ncbi:hypothetical protein AOLI_G00254820 [Acnodon oligacanthus]
MLSANGATPQLMRVLPKAFMALGKQGFTLSTCSAAPQSGGWAGERLGLFSRGHVCCVAPGPVPPTETRAARSVTQAAHSICCQRRSERHLPARSSPSARSGRRCGAPSGRGEDNTSHACWIAGKKKYSRDWEFGEGGSSLKRNSTPATFRRHPRKRLEEGVLCTRPREDCNNRRGPKTTWMKGR